MFTERSNAELQKERSHNPLRLLLLPLGWLAAFGLAIGYFWAAGNVAGLPRGVVGFSFGILLPLLAGAFIARPCFTDRFLFHVYAGLLLIAGVPALLFVWLYVDTVWFNSPL